MVNVVVSDILGGNERKCDKKIKTSKICEKNHKYIWQNKNNYTIYCSVRDPRVGQAVYGYVYYFNRFPLILSKLGELVVTLQWLCS